MICMSRLACSKILTGMINIIEAKTIVLKKYIIASKLAPSQLCKYVQPGFRGDSDEAGYLA